jgi:hypothetical protein
MTALILATALLAQWPLPESEPEITVHQIQTIEVNYYTEFNGEETPQLVFWEKDRIDQNGAAWMVYKGHLRMYNEQWPTLEGDTWVWRGRGVEMRAQYLIVTGGYDSEQMLTKWGRVLRFPVVLRWGN